MIAELRARARGTDALDGGVRILRAGARGRRRAGCAACRRVAGNCVGGTGYGWVGCGVPGARGRCSLQCRRHTGGGLRSGPREWPVRSSGSAGNDRRDGGGVAAGLTGARRGIRCTSAAGNGPLSCACAAWEF
ncbi:MAG: hypothetical protein MZV63_19525 [Marinilabiliales bacterium]|nr:hypothetical protein [Marinilabiliales bacterium]